MSEIWDLLVIGYWVVTGATLIMVIIKLLFPQYIFTFDEVTEYKSEVYNCVLELIQEDLGVQIKDLRVIYDYCPNARNEIIVNILTYLDEIDFRLDEVESDVIGDAYEYLIAKFASGAGKSAGEFYTPQQVSKILSKIITTGKNKLKSLYDPTCGSGSLLPRVAREVEVGEFYGQELNRTTFNLARMNMIIMELQF